MGHEAVRAGSGFRVCRNCQGLWCRSFELRFEQHALFLEPHFLFGALGLQGWLGGWAGMVAGGVGAAIDGFGGSG